MSTRSFQPGDSYGVSFTVKSSTGALVNADSTPAGSAYHNGSADGTVTVTISNPTTGVYSASCTIPSGYAVGDRVSFLVTATIGGVATGEFIDHIRLVGYPNNALPNAAAAASGGVPTVGTGSGQINPDGTGAVPVAFGTALPNPPTANTVGESLVLADLLGGRRNAAQAGASTTITLDASASSDANAYIGDDIYLLSGTGGGPRGTGQRRTIVAYNTSTKVATVQRAWDTIPDNTSVFVTLPQTGGNVLLWNYGQVPSPSQSGVPITDTHYWNGTAFASTATAGIPDVNVKNYNNVAAATDANNLPIVDVGDWLGHAVTVDSNNAPNVSVKYFGSTAVTGRDIGSSVLLSSGTGTGQLNVTSGVVQANTVQFNGHNVVTDSNNYPGVNIMDVAGQAASYYTGQAQGPGTGSNQIQLAAAEASNPLFRQISLVGGTGAGQVAICTAYNSSTKTATINCPQGTGGNWAISPDSSSLYAIDGLSAVLDSNGNAHVLGLIKQNQQLNHYPFYLALSSDHMSPATGKTVSATRNIYDGNGFVACANSPTEDGNGWYNITLTAGDLNAPTVALRLTAPGCDPVNINLVTTP